MSIKHLIMESFIYTPFYLLLALIFVCFSLVVYGVNTIIKEGKTTGVVLLVVSILVFFYVLLNIGQ